MTWNHRVIRQVCGDENFLGVHEVFYNDKDIPDMCTTEPVGVCGESIEALEQVLSWMQKAIGQPTLEMTDFEEGGKYYTPSPSLDELLDQVTDENINIA